MDIEQLYNITSDTINDYNTGAIIPESNVTAIADLLLDCGEKDGRHGYVRKSEALVRHLNPDVAFGDEGNGRKPDKAVHQRYHVDQRVVVGEIIRIERLHGERKVLIVECKSDHDFNQGAIEQIRAYMTLAEFPHGLLLSQRRASFYRRDIDGAITLTLSLNNISQHVREIAAIIRNM